MSELEKKYYESPEFWKGTMLHDRKNFQRLEATASLIPEEVHSLADIGCGNGVFEKYLQQHRPSLSLLAVDRSATALSFVNTETLQAEVTSLPLPDRSYDCVTCLEVLEHVPNDVYPDALAELSRVSRKYIVVSVPYKEDLTKNATQCPQCLSVFNSDLHLRSYDDAAMKSFFDNYGFQFVEMKNVVKMKKYAGVDYTRQVLNGQRPFRKKKLFMAPVCPVCGYENGTFQLHEEIPEQTNFHGGNGNGTPARSRGLVGIIKKIWPKKNIPGYWIIALYKRVSG